PEIKVVVSAIAQRFRVVRTEAQRLAAGWDRFLVPAHGRQRATLAQVELRVLGVQCDRLVERDQRLVILLLLDVVVRLRERLLRLRGWRGRLHDRGENQNWPDHGQQSSRSGGSAPLPWEAQGGAGAAVGP